MPTFRHFATALLAALLLFGLFSVAREELVPHGADFERARWRLTGDEPAYMLTAQAIASGDGEDVSRVHAAGTYTNFQERIVIGPTQWTWADYQHQRCPYWIDRSESWSGGKQVIQRPPLIAVFAAPFALSPRHPRWSILFAQGVFTSLAVFFMLLLAVDGRVGRKMPLLPGVVACIAVFGSMPVLYYTAEIFPEVIMGCLLALAMMLWRNERRALHLLALPPLFASLWGSGRVVPGVALATLAMAWQEMRARRWATIALLAAGWCCYVGYNLWLWGYPVPPTPESGGTLTISRIPVGLAENFIGNDVGLFTLCPAALAGAACCVLNLLRHRDDPATLPSALLFAGVALVVASFSNPRAGTCPAGRYQVAQAIVLVVPMLVFFAREPLESRARRVVIIALCALGAVSVAMGATVMFHPAWWYERFHPFFKIGCLQRLYPLLPNFRSWFVQ